MKRIRVGLRAVVVAASAFLSAFSLGGTYVASYSGGTISCSPYGFSKWSTSPYRVRRGIISGGGYCRANSRLHSRRVAGSMGCSGLLRGILTWVPGKPGEAPPQLVIVRQTCSASYAVSNKGAGMCDDGVGDSAPGGPRFRVGRTVYTVVSSGTNLMEMDVTPTAMVSDLQPSPNVHVQYSVAAIVPVFTLIGTTTSADKTVHVVSGQQLKASVDPGFPFHPAKGDTIVWNLYGFAHFSKVGVNGPPGSFKTPTNSKSMTFALVGDALDTTRTVTLSATVTLAALGGKSFTLHEDFIIDPPAALLTATIDDVEVYTDPLNHTLELGMYGYDSPADGIVGIYFTCTTTDPTGYVGRGRWCYAQIIAPIRTTFFGHSPPVQPPNNGEFGLDNGYPYPFHGGWFVADTNSDFSQDLPCAVLATPDEVSAVASDTMTMHVMYKPPGTNPTDVLMQFIGYRWAGSSAAPDWTLVGGSASVDPQAGWRATQPTWTLTHSNDDLGSYGSWPFWEAPEPTLDFERLILTLFGARADLGGS